MESTRSTKKLFTVISGAAMAAAVFGSTACSAPSVEATANKSEKLLAPKAVLTTHASALTKKQLGIAEWRVYRGKSDYVLTGYDAKGKAVKGVAVAFLASSGKARPSLRGRLLDGSMLAAKRPFDGRSSASTNRSITGSTRTFVTRAIVDMGAASASIFRAHHDGKVPKSGFFGEKFPAPGGASGTPAPPTTPTTPTTPGLPFPPDDPFGGMGYPGGDPMGGMDGGACGMDMATIMMSALQCLMSGALGGTGAPTSPPGGAGGADLMQCIQAALAGASAGGTCADPTGGGAGVPGSPGAPGTPGAPGGADDPYGGGMGAPEDPYGTGGVGGAGDPYGSGAADEAGGPMSCLSCPAGGGYDDLGMDPASGDVYGGEGGAGDAYGGGGAGGYGEGW